ncbi:uncharacterized protein LOC128731251 [Anopheles nili]|uniref:uncharacterized protein LOC128731251 n=1 Tax=Anopheles nili TaxID=185578 RepID=UPI00237A9769|nr:uncharacterized protein LOC128731251 [Anopheles nili]
MKLLLLSAFFFLASLHAAQSLRCMQGTELVLSTDTNSDKDKEKIPEYTECGLLTTSASVAALLLLKPNTATFPSTDYKCFHMRVEESETRKATIVKGCIYKAQNVCDGQFKLNTMREVFCSQCDQDECNSAFRFASSWKVLGLSVLTIICFFFNV